MVIGCNGPLPVVTIGRKELTWEPHSTQDLEALSDVWLLWDARHPPGCAGSRNLEPRSPTPGTPLPQPYPAGTRNPEPRLEPEAPQPQTRRQADRLKRPPLTDPPLALDQQCPNNKPQLAGREEPPGRGPALGSWGKDARELAGRKGGGCEQQPSVVLVHSIP